MTMGKELRQSQQQLEILLPLTANIRVWSLLVHHSLAFKKSPHWTTKGPLFQGIGGGKSYQQKQVPILWGISFHILLPFLGKTVSEGHFCDEPLSPWPLRCSVAEFVRQSPGCPQNLTEAGSFFLCDQCLTHLWYHEALILIFAHHRWRCQIASDQRSQRQHNDLDDGYWPLLIPWDSHVAYESLGKCLTFQKVSRYLVSQYFWWHVL